MKSHSDPNLLPDEPFLTKVRVARVLVTYATSVIVAMVGLGCLALVSVPPSVAQYIVVATGPILFIFHIIGAVIEGGDRASAGNLVTLSGWFLGYSAVFLFFLFMFLFFRHLGGCFCFLCGLYFLVIGIAVWVSAFLPAAFYYGS